MWDRIAKEMAIPWRAAEAMHWELGQQEMAQRAGVQLFSIAAASTAGNLYQPSSVPSGAGMSMEPPYLHGTTATPSHPGGSPSFQPRGPRRSSSYEQAKSGTSPSAAGGTTSKRTVNRSVGRESAPPQPYAQPQPEGPETWQQSHMLPSLRDSSRPDLASLNQPLDASFGERSGGQSSPSGRLVDATGQGTPESGNVQT